jgi:hypothetical protein
MHAWPFLYAFFMPIYDSVGPTHETVLTRVMQMHAMQYNQPALKITLRLLDTIVLKI